MSAPQTQINIVSGVAIDSRYRHSIYFPSRDKQLEFFGGKVVKRFSAYSYCRKSWSLKVDATMEEARTWSYLYFQNIPSGKWWFYFIDTVEYKGDRTVELTLTLDVIQTYMFDWNMKRCFIERTHVSDDRIGANTVDEGLDLGEMEYGTPKDVDELDELCIMFLSTYNPLTTTDENNVDTVLAGLYNKVYSGLGVYVATVDKWQAVGAKLKLLTDAGLDDGIVSIWMYPKKMVNLADGYAWDDNNLFKPVANASRETCEHVISTTFDGGWQPKNNKLHVYPFKFLQVSNNQGDSAVYKYEVFNDGNTSDLTKYDGDELTVIGSLYGGYSPDATVKYIPMYYHGYTDELGVSMGGFPTCAWNADSYKIWLAQNQNKQAVSNTFGGLSILAGAATLAGGVYTVNPMAAGAGVGLMTSGLNGVLNNIASKADKEVQAPQARGHYSASVNIVSGKQTFTFLPRRVKVEHAIVIDDFFTMYGYKTNHLGVPNLNVRPAFTYIKTVGCTIGGNICNDDRMKIESIFDEGITFWKEGDKIGDYTQDNAPIEGVG